MSTEFDEPLLPAVQYTVKELLARIDGKIDTLTATLQNKADKSEVLALERELRILHDDKAEQSQVDKLEQKVSSSEKLVVRGIGTIAAGAALAVAALFHVHIP